MVPPRSLHIARCYSISHTLGGLLALDREIFNESRDISVGISCQVEGLVNEEIVPLTKPYELEVVNESLLKG